MATLLAVYNSEGCVGRCDANCYEAKSPDCQCVCGGRNHGAGLKQAMENTRELFEPMLEAYCMTNGILPERCEVFGADHDQGLLL